MLSSDSAMTEVTAWLRRLEAGHDQAAQRLWELYFGRLVRLVQSRMRATDRRVADAEDLAASAFASFCRGVEQQRFPELQDRHGLWRLLVSITIRKLLHLQRDQGRQKRGGTHRQVEPSGSLENETSLENLLSREPSPEFAVQVAEQFDQWMRSLESEELQRLAVWKLEGFTNEEIAAKSGRATRTIERKLNLIRKILVHELDPAADAG